MPVPRIDRLRYEYAREFKRYTGNTPNETGREDWGEDEYEKAISELLEAIREENATLDSLGVAGY